MCTAIDVTFCVQSVVSWKHEIVTNVSSKWDIWLSIISSQAIILRNLLFDGNDWQKLCVFDVRKSKSLCILILNILQ